MHNDSSNQEEHSVDNETGSRQAPYWIWTIGAACVIAVIFGFFVTLQKSRVRTRSSPAVVPSAWHSIPEMLCAGYVDQAKEILNQDTRLDRPPDQLVLFALLCAYVNDVESSARLLNRAASELPVSATEVTYRVMNEKLDAFGFTEEDLYRGDFDLEDAQYVYRAFLYRCIAEGVLSGVPEGLPQANALVGWIRRMIAPSQADPTIVLPVTILARGFGTADQMCWALLTIARQKGIFGYMIHLWDPDKEEAVHTICQIFPGGKAMLCDPYHGIVLSRPTGEPLSLFWVNKELSPLQQYAPYRDGLSQYFEQARVVWWPIEAQSVLSRMKFLQEHAEELPLTPVLFQNVDEEMGVIRKYFLSLPGGRNLYDRHKPDIALYPFSMRTAFKNPEQVELMNAAMRHYHPLSPFRLLHLQSQFAPAEAGYTQILESSQPLETREVAAVFKAECLLEMGEFQQSREFSERFLATNPNSSWTNQVRYYLAITERLEDAASTDTESEVDADTDLETPAQN